MTYQQVVSIEILGIGMVRYWSQRQNMGPPSQAVHSMTYDDDKNVTILFGGIDNTSNLLGDTWELKVRVKT